MGQGNADLRLELALRFACSTRALRSADCSAVRGYLADTSVGRSSKIRIMTTRSVKTQLENKLNKE